jgi:hypothetical protein
MTDRVNVAVQWITDELTTLEAFTNELEDYIVRSQVYHPVLVVTAGGTRQLIMSGGDLLVRLQRLREQAAVLSPEQQRRFGSVASQLQQTISSLRTRFHDLLRHELKARRDQLTWNVDLRRESESAKADAAQQNHRGRAANKAAVLPVSEAKRRSPSPYAAN